MSYHIYTTEGIVLRRQTFNEGNLLLYVLTKDFGLIIASAQSARLIQSKLRNALQEYSQNTLSLVQGKNGWKIVNTSAIKNFFLSSDGSAGQAIARISSALLQMMPGEGGHDLLFDTVQTGFEYMTRHNENIPVLETILLLRIMFYLGYVSSDQKVSRYLGTTWDHDIISCAHTEKQILVDRINMAFKASQL